MPQRSLKRALLIGCALAALLAAGADGALVKVNGLVLRADGGFQPRELPRGTFTPIRFRAHVDIAAAGGGQPAALQEAVIDFDRDGRLSAGGLAVCTPESIAAASPQEARQACPRAIVGSGRIEAQVTMPGLSGPASSPLTIFNGPPQEGVPTVLFHARTNVPPQTFAIVVPVERRKGEYRYRATLRFPPIAGGFGAITHIDVDIGRRFVAGGKRRSYVAARCSDGILRTHGRFVFADGTIIDGSVEKPCLGH
jgi:hypothetical protein